MLSFLFISSIKIGDAINSGLVLLGVLIPAYLLHRRELLKHKLQVQIHKDKIKVLIQEKKEDKAKIDFFNRAMDLSKINPIIEGVDFLFKNTVADRFLILIAINGKTEFNIVSVIFEQHKNEDYKVNAIGTYREVKIDSAYRKLLKESEFRDHIEIDVEKMEDSILKDFYMYEGVKYSKIRFLDRQQIDDENDFVIYSSLATHKNTPFTKRGKTLIKTTYEGNIIPNIKKVIS